LDEQVK